MNYFFVNYGTNLISSVQKIPSLKKENVHNNFISIFMRTFWFGTKYPNFEKTHHTLLFVKKC